MSEPKRLRDAPLRLDVSGLELADGRLDSKKMVMMRFGRALAGTGCVECGNKLFEDLGPDHMRDAKRYGVRCLGKKDARVGSVVCPDEMVIDEALPPISLLDDDMAMREYAVSKWKLVKKPSGDPDYTRPLTDAEKAVIATMREEQMMAMASERVEVKPQKPLPQNKDLPKSAEVFESW